MTTQFITGTIWFPTQKRSQRKSVQGVEALHCTNESSSCICASNVDLVISLSLPSKSFLTPKRNTMSGITFICSALILTLRVASRPAFINDAIALAMNQAPPTHLDFARNPTLKLSPLKLKDTALLLQSHEGVDR